MSEGEVKLTIGEDKVTTVDVTKGQVVDLKERDPENLHDTLRVSRRHMRTSFRNNLAAW